MESRKARDAYLDAVLIGGREAVDIVIADYDDAWPRRFAAVRERLAGALGSAALTIDHVGSTAVPGLAAKPIIDVLLTVSAVGDEGSYRPALESAGFALRVKEPEHRMFRTPARDVHVHVYEPAHTAVTGYLELRDWLREHASDRDLYARAKRRLAQQSWTDMNHYADAKTDVVNEILARARSTPQR